MLVDGAGGFTCEYGLNATDPVFDAEMQAFSSTLSRVAKFRWEGQEQEQEHERTPPPPYQIPIEVRTPLMLLTQTHEDYTIEIPETTGEYAPMETARHVLSQASQIAYPVSEPPAPLI